MRGFIFLSLLMLTFVPSLSRAQDACHSNCTKDGETYLNLSATERRTLPQDLLTASLRIEVEGKDAKSVQTQINNAMKKALETIKATQNVKSSTGAYSVYKYENSIPNPRTGQQERIEVKWQGSQTIDLESKESEPLLDLVGKIQTLGFAMNDMAYTLSPEKMESIRDEMMVSALKKLQDKAALAAKTLGKDKYDLVDVSLDNPDPVTPMYKGVMMRAEAMSADAVPAPVADAGETDVTMTVSARARLK